MRVAAFVRFRVALALLAAMTVSLTVSGCGGAGWGDNQPAISPAAAQSQSQTVIVGQTATFTVKATGTGPLTYQWYVNGSAISGATSSSYITPATVSSQNGSVYTVAVTNAGGTVMSAPYTLTVNTPPAITVQPTSQAVYVGQSATFTVTATGTAPLSYQWYQGATAVSGATTNSFTTPVTTIAGDNSAYSVVVTNVAGTVTSAVATLTVEPLVPTLAFAAIAGQTYGVSPFPVSATSASSGAVTYTVASGPATIAGNVVTVTGMGTVVLDANQAANGNYTAATTTISFSVAAETPTLTFAAIAGQTYGVSPFPVSATSASSGAVTYTVASGPATIAGNVVTVTGMGTVVLDASQVANGNYTAATATISFSVAAETPTLTFAAIAGQTYGVSPFPVSATSASSGAVTYTVASGPATIAGNVVTVTGMGTVVLDANQAANGNYTAATATISFSVAAETPTLTFAAIAGQTYGVSPFPVSATSASSGAVTYTVASGPATIAGNVVTVTGMGTVVLDANQAANGNYTAATATISFSVAAETPTLTFAAIAGQTYGVSPFPVSATSASSGAVTYTVASGPATIAGNVVTVTGMGTVVLDANQAANGNYTAATTTISFSVAAETPTLTFAAIAGQTYGVSPFPVSATSASSGAVTYTVASGPATIAGNVVTVTGMGTVVLDASQAANGNYTAATATISFSVAAETPTLTFAAIAGQTYGVSPFPVSATSASSGAVTYTVASGPATIAGNVVTVTGMGTVVLDASQAANGNYTAATTTTSFSVTEDVTITSISPTGITVAPGQQTFSATVSGGVNDTITWSASGGTITSGGVWTSPNTAGVYTITATSTDNPSVHTSATVTVTLPVITTQPVSQNLCGNGDIALTVAANYASSYQWYMNGTAISGATDSAYNLSSATSSNSGNYTVVVSNAAGSVTSGIATEVVGSSIATNPSNLQIIQYQTASFNVSATGKSPFTYQWYSIPYSGTGTAITGATSSIYITPVETSATPAGQPIGYYATVTDACGDTLTSSTANLTVNTGNSPPTITIQPLGQTIPAGNTATFTVTATGTGALSYQWYRIPVAGTNQEIQGVAPTTGTAISGATSASYTVPTSATASGNDQDVYYVVVSNTYGQAVSQRATLAVEEGIQIQITNEPINAYVNAGASASFIVTATSTAPLSYQWYMVPPGESAAAQAITITSGPFTTPASAVAIEGATSATYTVPAASSGQTGTVYYVVVSNGESSSVTSNAASLFVGAPSGIPSCSANWNILGTTTAFDSGTCSYQLTAAAETQYGEIVWPTLISTGSIQLSFTITTSNPSSPPADGFAMVLGDPSLGATLTSVGETGEGLGARGIPGFVVAFDDFYNSACTSDCSPAPFPADPSTSANPDYLGVGRGEDSLWENPYFNVNNTLPVLSGDTYSLAQYRKTISHSYTISIVRGYMSVTMDGTQVFSGNVSVPPVAYLYVTSSTGSYWEQTVISNISATVSAPSN